MDADFQRIPRKADTCGMEPNSLPEAAGSPELAESLEALLALDSRYDPATGDLAFMEVNLSCNLWSRKTISRSARSISPRTAPATAVPRALPPNVEPCVPG